MNPRSSPLPVSNYRFLRGLVVGIAIGLAFMFAIQILDLAVIWWRELQCNADRDFAERWLAYLSQQAYPGGQHQSSALVLPFNVSPYPPLNFLVNGFLGQWLGGDLLTVRSVGRSVSLLSTVVSAGLIGRIAWRLGAGYLWVGLAIGCFLSATRAQMFAVSLRPDALALALMLAGLLLLVDRPRPGAIGHSGPGLRSCGAGFLLGLALTAKHNFIAVPMVWGLRGMWEAWRGRFGLLFGMGVGMGLAILAIAQLAHLCLGPHWPQLFQFQGFHRINVGQAVFFLGDSFSQPVLPLALASLFWVELNGPRSAIAAAFLVSLLLNCTALLKIGSAGNYFLEPVALGSILIALAMQHAWPNQRRQQISLLLLLIALQLPTTVSQTRLGIRYLSSPDPGQGSLQVVARLKAIQSPILTEFSGFYSDSGHQPYAMPGDLIGTAIEAGKIDGRPIEAMIEQRKFGAIVLRPNWQRQPFYPRSWLRAIESQYDGQWVEGWWFLTPKPPGAAASVPAALPFQHHPGIATSQLPPTAIESADP